MRRSATRTDSPGRESGQIKVSTVTLVLTPCHPRYVYNLASDDCPFQGQYESSKRSTTLDELALQMQYHLRWDASREDLKSLNDSDRENKVVDVSSMDTRHNKELRIGELWHWNPWSSSCRYLSPFHPFQVIDVGNDQDPLPLTALPEESHRPLPLLSRLMLKDELNSTLQHHANGADSSHTFKIEDIIYNGRSVECLPMDDSFDHSSLSLQLQPFSLSHAHFRDSHHTPPFPLIMLSISGEGLSHFDDCNANQNLPDGLIRHIIKGLASFSSSHDSSTPLIWTTLVLPSHWTLSTWNNDLIKLNSQIQKLYRGIAEKESEITIRHRVWTFIDPSSCLDPQLTALLHDVLSDRISTLPLRNLEFGFIVADWKAEASVLSVFPSISIRRLVLDSSEKRKSPKRPHRESTGLITREAFLEAWKSVAGLHRAKKKIEDLFFCDSQARRGVILHGPPGTGKTLLAKAVASAIQSAFFAVNGPSLMSPYIGETEQALAKVFHEAASSTSAVIFMDEVDAFLSREGSLSDRIIAEFVFQLDKAPSSVIVLASTNRLDLLDPSVLLPGRFDSRILLNYPETKEERIEILRVSLKTLLKKKGYHDEVIDFGNEERSLGAIFDLIEHRCSVNASPAELASLWNSFEGHLEDSRYEVFESLAKVAGIDIQVFARRLKPLISDDNEIHSRPEPPDCFAFGSSPFWRFYSTDKTAYPTNDDDVTMTLCLDCPIVGIRHLPLSSCSSSEGDQTRINLMILPESMHRTKGIRSGAWTWPDCNNTSLPSQKDIDYRSISSHEDLKAFITEVTHLYDGRAHKPVQYRSEESCHPYSDASQYTGLLFGLLGWRLNSRHRVERMSEMKTFLQQLSVKNIKDWLDKREP